LRSINERIVLAVLLLLALINLIFLIISTHSGPIVGFIVATAVAIHWWRKRDSVLIIIIAIVWIFIHIYELVVMGAGSQPGLFYLNLVLPILLLYCGLKEKRIKNIRSR
jgi:O-antigen/teichoic acid export membrane protein